jgi:hypothetical protein
MVSSKSTMKKSIGKKGFANALLAGLKKHAKAQPTSMEDKTAAAQKNMKAMADMGIQVSKAGMQASKALSDGLAQLMSGSKIQMSNIIGTMKTVKAQNTNSKGPILPAMNNQIQAFFG